ncbi:MAG TPA: GNAT family N-acetyltransferase [Thermomicrobiales bacterium]
MVDTPRFVLELLNDNHDRTAFSCGSERLDRYFRQQAGQEQRRGVATIYVALDTTHENAVVGFYTLSATAVKASTLPPDAIRKLPRYPMLPAVLLGRLARDERWRSQRIGSLLMVDAFDRIMAISAQLGAVFMVVKAKDDAARDFYERFAFQLFPNADDTLYLPLATIREMQRRFENRT